MHILKYYVWSVFVATEANTLSLLMLTVDWEDCFFVIPKLIQLANHHDGAPTTWCYSDVNEPPRINSPICYFIMWSSHYWVGWIWPPPSLKVYSELSESLVDTVVITGLFNQMSYFNEYNDLNLLRKFYIWYS